MLVSCFFSSYLSDTKPPADLESTFFDLEIEMENNMCRDVVCLDEECERRKF